MESLFVWIVIFAGAAIALLGVFLTASERELKKKRREIEDLLTRLEGAGQGHPAPSEPSPDHAAALAELRAANQELQSQVAGLTGKLERSRRTIEEMENQHSHAEDAAEAQQLRAANERLAGELSELRERLRASEAERREPAPADRDAGEGQLADARSEIAELKRQLDESQTQIRELRAAQQKIAEIDALEARHREERQTFQARLDEMEKQLSAERAKLGELEDLRAQMAESSAIEKSLREQIRSHEDEVPRWQARIAALEASGAQLAALQKPYHELLAKHASLADMQRELQRDLSALADMIGAPASAVSNGAETSPAPEKVTMTAAPAPSGKSLRFGILVALLVLAAGGALAAWNLTSSSAPAVSPVSAQPQHQAASIAQPPQETQPPAAPSKDQENALEAAQHEESKPAPKPQREAEIVPQPAAKPAAKVAGTYEVTRPGQVYAAPSEFSQRLGDIEPGTKVSVVDKRDGWLEIHSKHGRPPGFIRQNMAAPIGGRN